MKNSDFYRAVAFIMEGDTEWEFYLRFVAFICEKNGFLLEHAPDEYSGEPIDIINKPNGTRILVKYFSVGTITNMTQSAAWFKAQCSKQYQSDWHICLCYDSDDYREDVSRFYEGDWLNLRKKLKGAQKTLDMTACADIEDVLLVDKVGICNYLQVSFDQFPEHLSGSKGKRKMKNLFRTYNLTYHEGHRAQYLIEGLDMQLLIDSAQIPLRTLEAWFI